MAEKKKKTWGAKEDPALSCDKRRFVWRRRSRQYLLRWWSYAFSSDVCSVIVSTQNPWWNPLQMRWISKLSKWSLWNQSPGNSLRHLESTRTMVLYVCVYTWNPNDLYFWRDPTLQNKAEIPIKTAGSFGFQVYINLYIYIYVFIYIIYHEIWDFSGSSFFKAMWVRSLSIKCRNRYQVDGNEIRQTHQLRLVVEIPLFAPVDR